MASAGYGICGIGAVTGYGWGREALWNGLVSAKPAAILADGYGVAFDETAWVVRVPDGGDPEDGLSRFSRALRAAAREAIADAGARGWRPGRRVGLLHAVVLGDVDVQRSFHVDHHGTQSVRDYLALMPSTPTAMLMKEFGFHGPAMNVTAMCASGNSALITAKLWLDAGMADDVVFVATDLSANRDNVLHFAKIGVAVTDADPLDACRPFQDGSRGFVMGEASIGFVLSNQATDPYLRVLGGAMTHEAYHVISIEPSLTEIRNCFAGALENADVPASAVRYLNAHGTGTKQCDEAEATVLRELLPPETGVYSTKPLTGHCQGASAAVELAVAAMSYQRGAIPAPPTVADGLPGLLNGVTPMADGLTLKSSIGMGGHNAAVVLAPPA
ncbi:beta-ketoacyl synthase N-terminal-like domain-containing protein [Amycolatopsis anabasis]|uniref:beta-ketoacyl synthase N-terminal-like domain-containing protein n=1 Tax=Amycolatopsis anabasis TaxID=1840409 RepID=UPI00131E195C|nr:beta-ketoacyl synthase N-terminal-like domain-containing protein [Amycolatopsis anabasis]